MWIWQHTRHAAHPGPLGFVDVDKPVAGVLIAAGAALEVYDMYAVIDDTPLGPPITAVVLNPATVVADAAVDTTVGNISWTGGTPPVRGVLANNDAGNFAILPGSNTVKTAKTPLTEGAHTIRVLLNDDGGHVTAQDLVITVTPVVPPETPAATQAKVTTSKRKK
jgi:hypothetical protein